MNIFSSYFELVNVVTVFVSKTFYIYFLRKFVLLYMSKEINGFVMSLYFLQCFHD